MERAYRRNGNDWADVDLGQFQTRVTHRESGRAVIVTREEENREMDTGLGMAGDTPVRRRYNARIGVAAKKLNIPLAD